MNERFDIIVVGGGPCALAGLDALGKNRKIALVTGADAKPVDRNLAHAKIQTVALERGEQPGLGDRFDHGGELGKPLFSTAIKGGLANYWGQQFLRYSASDPIPRDIFKDHQTYLADCVAIERLFSLEGGEVLGSPSHLPAGFSLLAPRLLTGTADSPGAGLTSMRSSVKASAAGVRMFSSRAEGFAKNDGDGDFWSLRLSDGSTIEAGKILLAAGVLGNAQLVMASFADLAGAHFSDHAPSMLYTVGAGSLRKLRPATRARHFNALTIEKEAGGRCEIFASVYDMGAAEFNLLLASTIGRTFGFLRGWPAPPGASLIQPVQVWTARGFAHLQIEAGTRLVSSVAGEIEVDPALEETRAALKTLGARTLHSSRTAPGAGFHYHALKLNGKNGKTQPVADLLRERSAGAVACLDASILPTIGVRPHTLTAMATARRLVLDDASLR